MRRAALLIIVLALAVYLWWLDKRESTPSPIPPKPVPTATLFSPASTPIPAVVSTPVVNTNSALPSLRAPTTNEVSSLPPHPEARLFGSGSIPAEQEPAMVLTFMDRYREIAGSYPTGEGNAQFMNALRGNNPQRRQVFPIQHSRLNAQGELLDAWGTPFFFHSISRSYLQVRSAGPDRELYTDDDVLADPRAGLRQMIQLRP